MKKISKLEPFLSICLIFLLSGCSRPASEEDIKWAIDICSKNGGITKVWGENEIFYTETECKNSGKFIKK